MIKSILAVSFMTMVLMISCTGSYEQDIADYRGDGSISYLQAPFLGNDGVEILMDEINLSEDVDINYDLDGIPPHKADLDGYMVYLLIINPSQETLLPDKGTFSLTVYRNDKIIKMKMASFGQMWRPMEKGMPARYYMNPKKANKDDSFFVYVPESERTAHYRINVKIHLPGVERYFPGRVYLRIGGHR